MWTLRRQAARVVVLDPQDRVYLIQASDPANPRKGSWWELPGGGIEHGESSDQAAARELYEEAGITDAEVGPCIWQQHARYTFGGYNFDSHEFIHVARTPTSAVAPSGHVDYLPPGLEALEVMAFRGARWWDLGALAESVSSGSRLIPPWLVDQLPVYLRDGPADHPHDMGELGDLF